jgi:hypothetical protein
MGTKTPSPQGLKLGVLSAQRLNLVVELPPEQR